MSSTLVVVLWLGTSASYLHLQPDLEAWAKSRDYRIAAPAAPTTRPAPYDVALVERVESLLDRARIDWASEDLPSSRVALDEAARLLAEHPEWPQAAWLMAECLRQHAALHARAPEQGELTSELLAVARQLEGSRATPVVAPAEPAPQLPTGAEPEVPVRQLRPTDTFYDNGQPRRPPFTLDPGLHHLRVLRQGHLLWAGWHRVEPGDSAAVLPIAPPTACSAADLGWPELSSGSRQPQPALDVRCASWVIARPAPGGGLELAHCERSQCGPLRPWQQATDRGADQGATPVASSARAWPFVAAGLGAAALTGLILWQAGVFQGEREPETIWRIQGPPR